MLEVCGQTLFLLHGRSLLGHLGGLEKLVPLVVSIRGWLIIRIIEKFDQRGGTGQYLNPPQVLKKILKLVPSPLTKIEHCPIRSGARRVPEKTHPIAIPIVEC